MVPWCSRYVTTAAVAFTLVFLALPLEVGATHDGRDRPVYEASFAGWLTFDAVHGTQTLVDGENCVHFPASAYLRSGSAVAQWNEQTYDVGVLELVLMSNDQAEARAIGDGFAEIQFGNVFPDLSQAATHAWIIDLPEPGIHLAEEVYLTIDLEYEDFTERAFTTGTCQPHLPLVEPPVNPPVWPF